MMHIFATLITAATLALGQPNPSAEPSAQVVCGNARFTVLTDRLIRMEWAEDGVFEDRATLAIVNRKLPVPAFSKTRNGSGIELKTKALTLTYAGSGIFSADNLKVTFKLNGKPVTWRPGADASGNLLGTSRTLDGFAGNFEKMRNPIEPGILSRDGWAVVDESTRHLFVPDDSDWGFWVDARPQKEQRDWYIFAYGHDYKAALADYARIAGAVPMPPKYVFGYWWSRYWAYTDDEFLALGKEFRDRKLPIDVMVIDMDWHHTWPKTRKRRGRKDEFGQRVGWTGYSWNRDLIGDPDAFLKEVHGMNLKTSLNLHPASGIVAMEEVYPAFVADYLSRTDDYDGPRDYIWKEGDKMPNGQPAKAGYHAGVPFRMDQRAWADAYFNSVIHPLERQGVDFWWLDWQQFRESKYIPGLSNTFWLNHTFFTDKVRRSAGKKPSESERPMIYHRWGGLGSHRYQLGFSGDTQIKWEVLRALPWFTATASNVLYGYWGHDLGGHFTKGKNVPTDPELYTRWLQYGVFSPLFKTHCTTSELIERRFWAFENHYDYMKAALELRYALTPYIYDAARQAYQTAVSLCRPMYYEYPEEDKAYTFKEQYFFGDNILAATVCEPVDPATGKASRPVWFPAGSDWYDMAHLKMEKGGVVKTLGYTLAENAWFVKAGAIIPLAPEGIQNLQDKTDAMRIYIAPGKGRSSYLHYEDDEVSQAYPTEYTVTEITKNASASSVSVEIGARRGSYAGMSGTRSLTLVLGGLDRCPASAAANGRNIPVTYDAARKEALVNLGEMPCDKTLKAVVRY